MINSFHENGIHKLKINFSMKQQFQIGWQIQFVRVTLNLKKIHQFLYICSNFDFVYQISRSNFLLDCIYNNFTIFTQSLNNFKLEYIYIYIHTNECVLIQREKIRKLSRIEKAV